VDKWTSGQVDKWTSGQVDKWTSGGRNGHDKYDDKKEVSAIIREKNKQEKEKRLKHDNM